MLIATTNPGKLREIRAILAGLPARLESLNDHPPLPEAVEDADTFEANAKLKALHYAGLTGRWTLADDSGLEVDALDGAPGVYSSRYAGPACDPLVNNAKLVKALGDVPHQKRTARFCCVVALASPTLVLATASATWEGLILDKPRGGNGFGYDPHFFVPQHGMTSAEMLPEQKNRLSHRARAFQAIRRELDRLFLETPPP
ncbi:MAG: RdgB/HAM1 family non-canonical purine NTP pyrophosphatase [Planctomycetes bacterium]|nr:RdgB/HAM1 family non-canonical purine NTP pyrophosphatase [Planctomycetota bacterium]